VSGGKTSRIRPAQQISFTLIYGQLSALPHPLAEAIVVRCRHGRYAFRVT
jgi:hypothetical protein